jgi:hypothetical protein
MYKSFLSMIQESQEIDEMAIKPEDFPDTYLATAKGRGARARQISPLIKQFHDGLKALRWQDITWITRGSSYYPILPAELLAIVKAAKDMIGPNSDSFMESIISDNFGRWATTNDQSNCIHMEVDSGQRSHFPGGIPKSIRNVGLGYKLYRGLLQKKTWMRSNTSGTLEKDNAWASLISPKQDEQGNLTEDDVHAILGRSDVCAIIKTLSNSEKIRIAQNFINNNISTRDINSRNFAIDDELKAILPADFVAQLDPTERERIERERRARERQEQEARARQYGIDRGIQWDELPTERSLVYVRSYAANRDTNIPVRIIALIRNGQARALKIPEYLNWVENGSNPGDLDQFDSRTCSAVPEELKTYFVKVEPSEIPGLAEGTAVFLNSYTTTERAKVRDFVLDMVDPEAAARARAEREEAERTERERTEREAAERRARRAGDINTFGEPYENFEDAEYKRALETRVPGGQRISKLIKRGPQEIALSPAQMERFNRRKSTDVFANIGGDFYNTITGFEVEGPVDGIGFTQFRLERFTSKRAVTPNELIYIASHNTYYGILAPVDYVVLNRGRNEEYIYLRVYDNTSRAARKVAIKVTALRKLVAM